VQDSGLLRLLGVLTAVLVVASASLVGLSAAAPSALPRATADRPDEVVGEQVHFIYVLPTDAPDEQLDVNGELTASIARMQAWLAGQTGGPKLRLDTYQGQPDITFLRTSMNPEGLSVREYAERLGFTNPKKLYLMYAGSYPQEACGRATFGLKAAFVFLWCTSQYPRGSTFGLVEAAAMHEILHALGAVPEGAPHWDEYHVTDVRDLMYPSPEVGLDGEITAALDPGRDDYYGHSRSETDVADSPYLDSNPPSGTQPPKMRVGAVSRIKARGRLTVQARVSNAPTGRVSVQCIAKQGKRRLRVLAARYSAGTARCSFGRVRRGLVSGKIVVRSGQMVASRTFRLRA
jgi:hypothetical protein